MSDIRHALSSRPRHLHAVFVDFSSAFDTGSRTMALSLLAEYGVPTKLLGLIRASLQKNFIDIDDGVAIRSSLEQTNGFAQGENSSPILFSILTSKLPEIITTRHPAVKLLMFADDIVMYSKSKYQLQRAILSLSQHAESLGLIINEGKTEAMKFRNGGRLAKDDFLTLNRRRIKNVSRFTYLGITLTTTGTSFTPHIEERIRRTTVAFASIPSPQKLSVDTALKLFHLKLAPVASYGIQLIWAHLTKEDLSRLDAVKTAFLKRVLGLHRTTRNRLVLALCDTPAFTAELQSRFQLPPTEASRHNDDEIKVKAKSIDPEFRLSPAITSSAWKNGNFRKRHLITRFSVHGFHFLLCRTLNWHEPNESCTCRLCGQPCGRYHAGHCTQAPSLSQLAGP